MVPIVPTQTSRYEGEGLQVAGHGGSQAQEYYKPYPMQHVEPVQQYGAPGNQVELGTSRRGMSERPGVPEVE